MKVYFVRHGEPDYDGVLARRFIGMGLDMCELTEKGRSQAQEMSCDPRFKTAQLIVSSPFTRAMQTASYIVRSTGLDMMVETDLHEWVDDTTYQIDSLEASEGPHAEYFAKKGIRDDSCVYFWENDEDVRERALRVLEKYRGKYETIIVVCHGALMRILAGLDEIPKHCEVVEYEI